MLKSNGLRRMNRSNEDFEEEDLDKPDADEGEEQSAALDLGGAGSSDGPDEGDDDESDGALHGSGTRVRTKKDTKRSGGFKSEKQRKWEELKRIKAEKRRKRKDRGGGSRASSPTNGVDAEVQPRHKKRARRETAARSTSMIKEDDIRSVFLRYGRTVPGKGLVCEVTLKALVKELKKMGKKPRKKEDQDAVKAILGKIARIDNEKGTFVLKVF